MRPFKLLDLAPELRNNIYEHALTHDRSKGITAAVGLLRTCRQVYSEGKAILYEQSTFTINDSFSHREKNEQSVVDIIVDGDVTRTWIRHESSMEILRKLPRQLVEVPRIHMKLDFELHKGVPILQYENGALSRFFYALVDYLNSNSQPRRLEVSLEAIPSPNLSFWIDITLWPFQKLQPQTELDLQGGLRPWAQQIADQTQQHRQFKLFPTPLSEFLRTQTLYQSVSQPLDTPVHDYGHACLRKVKDSVHSSWGCCRMLQDSELAVNLLAAKGLLSMSTRQELAELKEPPDWLITCLEILVGIEHEAPRTQLKYLLSPLSHLIDTIPGSGDSRGWTQ